MENDYPALVNRRVLIVEDELLVAMDLEDLLIEQGCEVIDTVPTVAKALKAIADYAPELVLLDLNLAGQSTLPVAQALHQSNIAFVVVSGYGDLRASESALFDAPLVPKPWNRDLLLKRLAEVLANKVERD